MGAITSKDNFVANYNVKSGEHLNSIVLNRNENKLKDELNLIYAYQRYTLFGDSSWTPEWVNNAAITYYKDSLVKHNNKVYVALADVIGNVIPGTDTSKWKQLVFSAQRLDDAFSNLNITNTIHNSGDMLAEVTYEGGYKIKLTYNSEDLLTKAEYFDTDGVTKLAQNVLTYNVGGLLLTATWTNY